MLSGITFEESDIAGYITAFFGLGAVVAVLGLVLALKFVPKIAGALRGLVGRR